MTSSTDGIRAARSAPCGTSKGREPRQGSAWRGRCAAIVGSETRNARDLHGGQAGEQAQRQRAARLRGQQRVARHEHQAQEVAVDFVLLEGSVELRRGPSPSAASS
jgi:hypothetical protein